MKGFKLVNSLKYDRVSSYLDFSFLYSPEDGKNRLTTGQIWLIVGLVLLAIFIVAAIVLVVIGIRNNWFRKC